VSGNSNIGLYPESTGLQYKPKQLELCQQANKRQGFSSIPNQPSPQKRRKFLTLLQIFIKRKIIQKYRADIHVYFL
jgi:hypothetical protein